MMTRKQAEAIILKEFEGNKKLEQFLYHHMDTPILCSLELVAKTILEDLVRNGVLPYDFDTSVQIVRDRFDSHCVSIVPLGLEWLPKQEA